MDLKRVPMRPSVMAGIKCSKCYKNACFHRKGAQNAESIKLFPCRIDLFAFRPLSGKQKNKSFAILASLR
jgi:hypothetical protein